MKKISFSYDSFDRIVIKGYLDSFHQAKQLDYYFKVILGYAYICKARLLGLTQAYWQATESYARAHQVSCEYAPLGVRKDEYVAKARAKAEKKERFGVYYILKSKENEATYRVVYPNKREQDKANHFKWAKKPYTHYYFYIYDPVLGNMSIRIATYLPFTVTVFLNGHSYIERYLKDQHPKRLYKKRDNAFLNVRDIDLLMQAKDSLSCELITERINYWLKEVGPVLPKHSMNYSFFIDQVEYARNFVFNSGHFLGSIFKRSCELSMMLIGNDRIRQIFATRAGDDKLKTSLGKNEAGYFVFKAFFKRSWVKQYRKFPNFLRFEFTSNNLRDLGVNKALEHLEEIKEKATGVLDRYSETQSEMMNAHGSWDCFTHHSKPVMDKNTKISGIQVYQHRTTSLMQLLLHDNRSIGQFSSRLLHQRMISECQFDRESYGRTQLTYDLRKLRAHGIVERVRGRNWYRLTDYGMKVSIAFTLMRQRLYGPMHHSLFCHYPDQQVDIDSPLERLYRRMDKHLDEIQAYLSGEMLTE